MAVDINRLGSRPLYCFGFLCGWSSWLIWTRWLESKSENGGKISDALYSRFTGSKATRQKGNKAIYSHRHLISSHPLHFILRTTSLHPPFYISFVDLVSSLRSLSYIPLGFLFVSLAFYFLSVSIALPRLVMSSQRYQRVSPSLDYKSTRVSM